MDQEPKRSKVWVWIVLVVVIIIAAGLIYYFWSIANQEGESLIGTITNKAKEMVTPSEVEASKFATYTETPVEIDPAIADYSVKSDLSNLENADSFYFSDNAKKLLAGNAFVAVPGYWQEFYSLYERNRYNYIPSFITTDSILHNYHLYFNFLLKKLETTSLTIELKDLNAKMVTAAKAQLAELEGTDWENAATRNLAFFSVGSKLLDSSFAVPSEVSSLVSEELALIEAARGIEESPIMNLNSKTIYTEADQYQPYSEDYSQYIPRGHYTKSEELKKYFKSMMWYGRLNFRAKWQDEVKSSVLMTLALANDEESFKTWERIFEPISFFVGKTDDMTYYDTKGYLDSAFNSVDLGQITSDADGLVDFQNAMKNAPAPEVNSMPISASNNPDVAASLKEREAEIKGYRFMGQRFTIDAAIFQKLICRDVGNKDGTTNCPKDDLSRMLPKALDIPAAMGSDEAYSILQGLGETDYKYYPENMAKMKDHVASLDEDVWTQNLYWGWLYSLKPLTEEKATGYPSFMQNDAWTQKQLFTYLGSWTELKHDTILYAKQVYAELGGGPIEEKDDRGYVEPEPYLYARLASLLKMTKEGLEIRGLIEQADSENLETLYNLVVDLKEISEKELNGVALTDDDYELIRIYGGSLEHFWLETFTAEEKASKTQDELLNGNPAALVADVATDPNGLVLEEGIGKVFDIYVVFPLDGKLKIAKGGIFSHYEFTVGLSERMTDEAWRERLDSGDVPSLASWTASFIAE